REPNFHPLQKRTAPAGETGCDLGQCFAPISIFGRLQTAALLTEFDPRAVHRAQRPAQFLVQIGRVPAFRIDRLDQLQMLAETFPHRPQLFESKSWNPADLHKELSRALSTVDGARVE